MISKILQALKSYESTGPMSQTLGGGFRELNFIAYDVFFCISSVVITPVTPLKANFIFNS